MNKVRRLLLAILILLLFIAGGILTLKWGPPSLKRWFSNKFPVVASALGLPSAKTIPLTPVEIQTIPMAAPTPTPSAPVSTPTSTPSPRPKPKPTPVKSKIVSAPMAPTTPPPVELHKELIPKDIEIVRVYYSQTLTGPGSVVEFDINGSGFNDEFQKMITVESGRPEISVKNLTLLTPNQIHGVLVVKSDAPTGAVFPEVLIQGKVVFRASEPFAVIRPGEVLNMIFTEMGENGRSGRFRVFTNLTQEMFSIFHVAVDTDAVAISDLGPQLPFIVDGTISIGAAREGSFGVKIMLGDKVIWDKPGMIRVVRPNLGQAGLAQQIRAVDGFQRPGDEAHFLLQGSGFQERDADVLVAVVDGLPPLESTFTFRSAGRMELSLRIPPTAKEGSYTLRVKQKDQELLAADHAFTVVGSNWMRRYVVDPPLKPGATSTLRLEGRDMDKDFIGSLQTSVDTSGLGVGGFSWVSPELATAPVSATDKLAAGDYLIHLTRNGQEVSPHFGNIIRLQPAN